MFDNIAMPLTHLTEEGRNFSWDGCQVAEDRFILDMDVNAGTVGLRFQLQIGHEWVIGYF